MVAEQHSASVDQDSIASEKPVADTPSSAVSIRERAPAVRTLPAGVAGVVAVPDGDTEDDESDRGSSNDELIMSGDDGPGMLAAEEPEALPGGVPRAVERARQSIQWGPFTYAKVIRGGVHTGSLEERGWTMTDAGADPCPTGVKSTSLRLGADGFD